MVTPEEILNQQVWEILQDIKEEDLATVKGKPVTYEFPHVQGVGIIPNKRRRNILYKLQELKAIKILNESPRDWRGSGGHILKFKLQPKFDEVYEKYQKACDIESYLNDFQQKLLDKKEKPKFSQVEQEEVKIDGWQPQKEDEKNEKQHKMKAEWSKDFKWQGKGFVFGKYGERSFSSKITRKMFDALTKAEGNWVTVKELKKISNNNEDYVRQTLWQIEKSFKPKLKKHVSIPSTTGDDLKPKPLGGAGAYRIKFASKPQ